MSCDSRYNGVALHDLSHDALSECLRELESQSKSKEYLAKDRLKLLYDALPNDVAAEVRLAVSPLLPRFYRDEINAVMFEISRREPQRRVDELLNLQRTGRLEDRLKNIRLEEAIFSKGSRDLTSR